MPFTMKQFSLSDSRCGMKVGTDGVLLGAWTSALPTWHRALDLGAGCGLVALMLAQRFGALTIEALEVDPGTAFDCRDNVAASPWKGRIDVVQGDFASWHPVERYDLIACNPPFYVEHVLGGCKSRDLARHPGSSMSVPAIFRKASDMLNPGGSLALILPREQFDDADFQASVNGMSLWRFTEVYTCPHKPAKRMLAQWVLGNVAQPMADALYISDNDANYTDQYITLTKDFYLDTTWQKKKV